MAPVAVPHAAVARVAHLCLAVALHSQYISCLIGIGSRCIAKEPKQYKIVVSKIGVNIELGGMAV